MSLNNTKLKIRIFFWRIKNLLNWIPVLWKQGHYDYMSAIEVFQFQLNNIADYLESEKAWTASAKDKAKRIRTVLKLMDKVYSGEYEFEYQDKFEKKYGKESMERIFIEDPESPSFYRLKYAYQDWDNAEEISKERRRLFKESQQKQEKAHRILWALIEKDIRGWWD